MTRTQVVIASVAALAVVVALALMRGGHATARSGRESGRDSGSNEGRALYERSVRSDGGDVPASRDVEVPAQVQTLLRAGKFLEAYKAASGANDLQLRKAILAEAIARLTPAEAQQFMLGAAAVENMSGAGIVAQAWIAEYVSQLWHEVPSMAEDGRLLFRQAATDSERLMLLHALLFASGPPGVSPPKPLDSTRVLEDMILVYEGTDEHWLRVNMLANIGQLGVPDRTMEFLLNVMARRDAAEHRWAILASMHAIVTKHVEYREPIANLLLDLARDPSLDYAAFDRLVGILEAVEPSRLKDILDVSQARPADFKRRIEAAVAEFEGRRR